MKRWTLALTGAIALALLTDLMMGQPPGPKAPKARPGGPGGPQRPGPKARPGGPGGPQRRGPAPGFRPFQMPLMLALDANRDGELSAEEIKNAAKALKTLDKDGDGRLSREELRPQFAGPGGPGPGGPGRPPGPGRGGPGAPGMADFVERIMGLDRNGDGKVTKDEMPERMQQMLERADANGDGAIDRKEAETMAARFRGGPGMMGNFVERIMGLDRNGDGKVTKDEMPERMQQMLGRADANGDGAIDRKEAETMAEQLRRAGGPPPGANRGGRPGGRGERPQRPQGRQRPAGE